MRRFMLCVACCVLHVVCCMLHVRVADHPQAAAVAYDPLRRHEDPQVLNYGTPSLSAQRTHPPCTPPCRCFGPRPTVLPACYSGTRDVVCCPARATLHAMQPGDHGDPLVGVLLVSRLGPLRVSRLVGPSSFLAHSTPVLCKLQERFVSDSAAAPHALCIPMDALHCAAPVRAGTACR